MKNFNKRSIIVQEQKSIVLFFLILFIGAALRLYALGAKGYWLDEIIMVHVARGSLKSILFEGGRPPVYVLLAHFWIKIFGTSEAATRSLSALAGIASIAVMYLLAKQLFGKSASLISTSLMAISEFQIHFSQDFRYYSLFLLMTLLSYFFFVRFLKTRKAQEIILYALTTITMLFTHTYGVFIISAQILYIIFRWGNFRKAWVPVTLSLTLVLAFIFPELIDSIKDVVAKKGTASWLQDPPLWIPLRDLLYYVFPSYYIFHPSRMIIWTNILAGVAFFVTGILLFISRKGKAQWIAALHGLSGNLPGLKENKDEIILVSLWLLCPIVIPFVFSKIFNPFYFYRYTICASPGLYLLLGSGIVAIEKIVPKIVSLVTLLVLILPGLQYFYKNDFLSPWQEIAEYVEKNANVNDALIIVDKDTKWYHKAFYWYYRGPHRACNMPQNLNEQEAIAEKLSGCISGRDRFWLILKNPIPHAFKDPCPSIRKFFLDSNRVNIRLEKERKYMVVSIYLFVVTKH